MKIAQAIASVGGVGRLPGAPGTWASLLALAGARAGADAAMSSMLALCASLAAVGTWASHLASRGETDADPSWIVVDEVCGMLVAALFVDKRSVLELFAAFIAFRAFDMLKPWPVGWLDRNVRGGFGIMLDDLVAGLAAGALVSIVARWPG